MDDFCSCALVYIDTVLDTAYGATGTGQLSSGELRRKLKVSNMVTFSFTPFQMCSHRDTIRTAFSPKAPYVCSTPAGKQ